MDSVLFDFGFFQIKWYSFFILIGVLVAAFLVSKESIKKGLDNDTLLDIMFYTMIVGLLGARIYYVLFNLDYYLQNPIEIVQVWNGGLAIHGGIIAGLVFLSLYTKKKKINIWLLLDIMAVALIIAQAIGRWGNFFNGEAYGREVTLEFLKNMHLPNFIIKGMYINGSYREPTFLYESILSLIGFIVLLGVRKIKRIKTGTIMSIYLIWYGISRLIIESFRSDSLMLGNIKMAQLVSMISILSGIIIIIRSSHKNKEYQMDKLV